MNADCLCVSSLRKEPWVPHPCEARVGKQESHSEYTRDANQNHGAVMEKLEQRGEANVKVIEGLLRESFEEANIVLGDSPLDGRKFKVAAKNGNMFLCVSLEYLNDRDELSVRKDFDNYGVARTLETHPKEYFLLCKQGLQPIAASTPAS